MSEILKRGIQNAERKVKRHLKSIGMQSFHLFIGCHFNMDLPMLCY